MAPGVASTLVLGAKPGGTAAQPRVEGMAAHAWLRVGSIVLLCNEARGGFVPIMCHHTESAESD